MTTSDFVDGLLGASSEVRRPPMVDTINVRVASTLCNWHQVQRYDSAFARLGRIVKSLEGREFRI